MADACIVGVARDSVPDPPASRCATGQQMRDVWKITQILLKRNHEESKRTMVLVLGPRDAARAGSAAGDRARPAHASDRPVWDHELRVATRRSELSWAAGGCGVAVKEFDALLCDVEGWSRNSGPSARSRVRRAACVRGSTRATATAFHSLLCAGGRVWMLLAAVRLRARSRSRSRS
jgi:hypothetical protein